MAFIDKPAPRDPVPVREDSPTGWRGKSLF